MICISESQTLKGNALWQTDKIRMCENIWDIFLDVRHNGL